MELIVLNVGLQAGILDTRIFSMFVVHAVVLTVMTTPLTLLFYSPEHRSGKESKRNKVEEPPHRDHGSKELEAFKTKFAVVLNRIEHLPAMMTITQILQSPLKPPSARSQTSSLTEKDEKAELSRDITQERVLPAFSQGPPSAGLGNARVTIDALRLIELTARTSAVMKSSEADDLLQRDALISVFSTFGRLNRIQVSTSLSIVAQDAFPSSVATHARDTGAQLVIVPWHSGNSNALADESHVASADAPTTGPTAYNPFDGVFGKGSSPERTTSVVYANFIRNVFSQSPTGVALFVERGSAAAGDGHHIFLPFFGGPDDRLALTFVVQLCSNPNISATVLRMTKTEKVGPAETKETEMGSKVAEALNSLTVQSVRRPVVYWFPR